MESGPNSVIGGLVRRGKFRHRETQRQRHVKVEAETGVMHLADVGCQGLLVASSSWEKGLEPILPRSLQKGIELPTS